MHLVAVRTCPCRCTCSNRQNPIHRTIWPIFPKTSTIHDLYHIDWRFLAHTIIKIHCGTCNTRQRAIVLHFVVVVMLDVAQTPKMGYNRAWSELGIIIALICKLRGMWEEVGSSLSTNVVPCIRSCLFSRHYRSFHLAVLLRQHLPRPRILARRASQRRGVLYQAVMRVSQYLK